MAASFVSIRVNRVDWFWDCDQVQCKVYSCVQVYHSLGGENEAYTSLELTAIQ